MNDLITNKDFWSGPGIGNQDDVYDLLKALEANDGTTDISLLSGGPALGPQSLETLLAVLTLREKNLTLWRDMPRNSTRQTLHEYTAQLGIGQGNDGFVGQIETPLEADPQFKRKYGAIKYNRQMWKFADVAGIVGSIKPAEVASKEAASLRALRSINKAMYSGDDSLIPESINGFEKVIRGNGSSYHVIDSRGNVPTQDHFDQAAQLINDNFGDVDNTTLYSSSAGLGTLSKIMRDTGFAGASSQRIIQGNVGADGGISMGYKVREIFTNFGTLKVKNDIFIGAEYEGKNVPKTLNLSTEALVEGATSLRSPQAPSSITATPVAATVTGTKWAAAGVRPSGATYRYRVVSRNRFGQSVASAIITASGNVVTSGAVDVAITPVAVDPYPATCFEIYGEQVTNSGDFKYMGTIPASGTAVVTYRDLNAQIPGTTKYFILDMTANGENRVSQFIQLAPMHSKEYSRLGEFRWGVVCIYGEMFVYAPLRCVLIENVPVSVATTSQLINV